MDMIVKDLMDTAEKIERKATRGPSSRLSVKAWIAGDKRKAKKTKGGK